MQEASLSSSADSYHLSECPGPALMHIILLDWVVRALTTFNKFKVLPSYFGCLIKNKCRKFSPVHKDPSLIH